MPGFDGLQSGFFKRWGGLLAIGAGVLVIAFIFLSKKNAASTPSATGTSTAPGTTPDGQPLVEYVPTTGDSYTNIDYSSGNTTNTDSDGTSSPTVGPPTPVPGVQPIPPIPGNPSVTPNPGVPSHPVGPIPPQPAPAPNPRLGPIPPQPAPHSMPPIPPTRPPVPVSPGKTYTVAKGDTLSAIAAKFKIPWQVLYQNNKNVIDQSSAQHGNPNPGGPWNNIFGGEVLNVPA